MVWHQTPPARRRPVLQAVELHQELVSMSIPFSSRLVPCLAGLTLLLLTSCGGDRDDSHGRPLPEAIDKVMSKPIYSNASWGLRVVDLDSGELVYDVGHDRNFLIASVRKLFSVGLALDTLGAEHRFSTSVHRRGTVDPAGVLDGDLILVASGDLSMGVAVDLWRSVYTLNYELLLLPDTTVPGISEPSVSVWVPPPPP